MRSEPKNRRQSVKKPSIRYDFAVEGKCEIWYLQRLQDILNEDPRCVQKVLLKGKKAVPSDYVKYWNQVQSKQAYCLVDR